MRFPRYTSPQGGRDGKVVVNHSGTTGEQVTLKAVLNDAVLTDEIGVSVTQIVTRARDVR
jgi:hypothetical protein